MSFKYGSSKRRCADLDSNDGSNNIDAKDVAAKSIVKLSSHGRATALLGTMLTTPVAKEPLQGSSLNKM
jgi:hypothetical protein